MGGEERGGWREGQCRWQRYIERDQSNTENASSSLGSAKFLSEFLINFVCFDI